MTTQQCQKYYFKRDELEQSVDVAEHIVFSADDLLACFQT